MTELTIIQDGQIRKVFAGLADSQFSAMENGLRRSYINRCIEHVIDFVNTQLTVNQVNNVKVSAEYPKFPTGKNQPLKTTLELPYVTVSFRGGASREIGIGRKRAETINGPAYAFWQFANIEFDCFGKTQEQADALAGFISEEIQIGKLDTLMQKGFIDWREIYSRPGYGFNISMPWDFPNRIYYPYEIFRHILYMETSFEVVWVKKDDSTGIINQIIFNESNGYFPDFSVGFGLEYLIAEDLQFGWHNIFV